MLKHLLVAAASVAVVAAVAPAHASSIVGPTAQSQMTAIAGSLRLRALNTSASQEEVYLGRQDLGVGGNRVAQNRSWTQNGANSFSFSYNAASDTLTSVVNGGPALNFSNFLGGLSPAIQGVAFNTLQISIKDAAVGAGTISLSDLKLNASSLAPLPLNGVEATETYWRAFGDFKQDFALTGTLNLAGGTFASNENNRVQFLIGNSPAPVPEPATWAMMIGGFGIVGSALRRRRALVAA